VKILNFALAGPDGPGHSDIIFAKKAHLPRKPGSARSRRMNALAEESLSVISPETFEAGKPACVFSRPSGTIELAPIQTTLRNVRAFSTQCLPPGDEHQGDVGLEPIEAKNYATRFCEDVTTDGS
jgi:hypothetical protein